MFRFFQLKSLGFNGVLADRVKLLLMVGCSVFKLKLLYKRTKYEENMTETSSENVLRSTTIMLLFVGLFGI